MKHKPFSSTDTPVGMTESCSRRAAVDTGIRHPRAYAKRANSEDSIEVLSTTESILTEDLTAITEEEAELQPLSNGFENEEELQMVDKSYKVLQEEETLNAPAAVGEDENDGPDEEDQCCVESEEPLEQTMVTDDIMIKEQPGAIKMNQFRKDNSEEKTSKLLQGNTLCNYSFLKLSLLHPCYKTMKNIYSLCRYGFYPF